MPPLHRTPCWYQIDRTGNMKDVRDPCNGSTRFVLPTDGQTAARTPRSRCRWSKATANRIFAVFECSATSLAKLDLDGEEKLPIETCAEQPNEFMPILPGQLSSVIRAGAKGLDSALHAENTKYARIY